MQFETPFTEVCVCMCDIIRKHMHSAHMHIQHYVARAAYENKTYMRTRGEPYALVNYYVTMLTK